jgi:hypothetical protein
LGSLPYIFPQPIAKSTCNIHQQNYFQQYDYDIKTILPRVNEAYRAQKGVQTRNQTRATTSVSHTVILKSKFKHLKSNYRYSMGKLLNTNPLNKLVGLGQIQQKRNKNH